MASLISLRLEEQRFLRAIVNGFTSMVNQITLGNSEETHVFNGRCFMSSIFWITHNCETTINI